MAARVGGDFVSWVSGLWVVGPVWVSPSCLVTAMEGARGAVAAVYLGGLWKLVAA